MLAIGVWAVAAATIPENQNGHVTQTNTQSEETAKQHKPAKSLGESLSIIWDRTFEDPVAFYTFVLGIFTGLLAIVSGTQIYFLMRADTTARTAADAATAQVRLSKDALINTERAFIFVSKIHAMAGLKGSTGEVIDWSFYCVWENAGGTATRRMFMQTNWHSFDGEIPDDFDFRDLGKGERIPMMVGPKSTTLGAASVVPIALLMAAYEKKKRIYMWGWVEYNDVFEGTRRHRTEYCYEIVAVGRPDIAAHGGEPHIPFEYRGHKRHNGTDEECLKTPLT